MPSPKKTKRQTVINERDRTVELLSNNRTANLSGWRLLDPLPMAMGAFGVVERVRKWEDAEGLVRVMKLELRHKYCTLPKEAGFYKAFKGCRGVPQKLDDGKLALGEEVVQYLVIEKLDYTFTKYATEIKPEPLAFEAGIYKIVAQLLETLRDIRRVRPTVTMVDLKPDNIMWNETEKRWFIIDFGSMDYAQQMNSFAFNGTPAFASSRALQHGGCHPDDDIEAVVYTADWAYRGATLPWIATTDYGTILKEREGYVPQLDGLAALYDRIRQSHECPFVEADFEHFITDFENRASTAASRVKPSPHTPPSATRRKSMRISKRQVGHDLLELRRSPRLRERPLWMRERRGAGKVPIF